MSETKNPEPGRRREKRLDAETKIRRRRKDARPGEIIEAALEAFAEHGYGGTKLEDVAKRSGVAKGTVFVYFANKEELFRAVAQSVLAGHFSDLPEVAVQPISEFVPMLLQRAAEIADSKAPAILRLLLSEARRFPDIAQVWYDEVVSKMMAMLKAVIQGAQARGEVRAGDPILFAFSIIGPMLAGTLFREIMGETSAAMPDLQKLAEQHARTVLSGMIL